MKKTICLLLLGSLSLWGQFNLPLPEGCYLNNPMGTPIIVPPDPNPKKLFRNLEIVLNAGIDVIGPEKNAPCAPYAVLMGSGGIYYLYYKYPDFSSTFGTLKNIKMGSVKNAPPSSDADPELEPLHGTVTWNLTVSPGTYTLFCIGQKKQVTRMGKITVTASGNLSYKSTNMIGVPMPTPFG
ncbi:hypothetical protein OH491_24395 [Termitidicoccus mucosus]|uniref:Uncharacterized protein n=1 Tax=Termitidicoccus mucosus TaxID=1184151 RepID=A0A178IQS9_9BACT|nr:hypothetical protein AW736_02060 [Opitutaceae bacterium TSB47]